ncbi:MAG: glycosyltransferase family 1 protein [Planctomycetes bacterium]|nr:glycosyltransferase family 1 protein [Planctomycetota bacterium]
MRLTLVTETFPPEVNGVARTVGRWLEAFRQRGHQVEVIRPRQAAEQPAPECVPGVPLPFYPEVCLGLAWPDQLGALLGRVKPDVVHLVTEGPLGWAALLAAKRLRLPMVSSFHTLFDDYLRHYGLGWLAPPALAYLRWFHNQTALTLAPSASARQRLLERGFRRVEIWSRGVDSRSFHPRFRDPELRRSLGLETNDPLLLYVGRLAPEKNLLALIEAFGRLRQHLGTPAGDKLRLALVGGGPLAGLLRTRQHPGVLLPGVQVGEALARWYASADVFAFPSLSETFGNVLLEAQASALPVVAFDCPALRERVRHGQDGLLVPQGDLAPSLLVLCRDSIYRRRLGTAAWHKALTQDWEPIFDALEERYYQIVVSSQLSVVRKEH